MKKNPLESLLNKARHPKEPKWIRSGVHAIDLCIGGGIPLGRTIEIFGNEQSGKSLLAWTIAKAFQDAGGVIILYDVEATAPVKFMQRIGVKVEEVMMPDEELDTVEAIRDSMTKMVTDIRAIDKDRPILVIWDSVAATSSTGEWEDHGKMEMKDHSMGARGGAMSRFFRGWTTWMDKHNVTLVCVNQLRDRVGKMWGPEQESPGGHALKFHASVRVELTKGKRIEKDGLPIGVICRVSIPKNKMAFPFRKAEVNILEDAGFEVNSGLIELLERAGRLKSDKGWVAVGEKKYRASALTEILSENPSLLDDWLIK